MYAHSFLSQNNPAGFEALCVKSIFSNCFRKGLKTVQLVIHAFYIGVLELFN